MSPLATKAYQALPPMMRDAFASFRGWQLRRWRYGAGTDQLVAEAIKRERWTNEEWSIWHSSQISKLLYGAASAVPHYREWWSGHGRQGRQRWDKLTNWPILKKASIRAHPRHFLRDGCRPERMWREHTSGSTGTPLTLWLSRQTIRSWYGLFEARWRVWNGLSRSDPWAILGGQLVVSPSSNEPPFWIRNMPMRQLYMSSYHLKAENVQAYADALRQHGAVYIWGYASSLFALASMALHANVQLPQLKAAISNAEPLYLHQREIIRRAFSCPVYDTYGMSEMVCAASECQHGMLHLWPEVGIYEVLRDDSDDPVEPGETGRLVCTGLLNMDMPLIRYEVGDRVALAPPEIQCPCGRSLPILKSVEGRNDDTILTLDGRRIGRLDPVFKADFPIAEAQIVQDAPDHLCVRVVPRDGFSGSTESHIIQALKERVGDMRVSIERVHAIPRFANGKFKAVICLVSQPQNAKKWRGLSA